MDRADDPEPEFTENPGTDNPQGLTRRRIVRRYLDEQPDPIDPYDEDAIAPRRLRWWHIAGSLLLIAVLLIDVLVPVVQGLLQILRFIPSTLGEPL